MSNELREHISRVAYNILCENTDKKIKETIMKIIYDLPSNKQPVPVDAYADEEEYDEDDLAIKISKNKTGFFVSVDVQPDEGKSFQFQFVTVGTKITGLSIVSDRGNGSPAKVGDLTFSLTDTKKIAKEIAKVA